jgi:hypothetical protein
MKREAPPASLNIKNPGSLPHPSHYNLKQPRHPLPVRDLMRLRLVLLTQNRNPPACLRTQEGPLFFHTYMLLTAESIGLTPLREITALPMQNHRNAFSLQSCTMTDFPSLIVNQIVPPFAEDAGPPASYILPSSNVGGVPWTGNVCSKFSGIRP